MKILLGIVCWLLAFFCCYFPFAYIHGEQDKKELKISHILVDSQQQALNIKHEIETGKSFEEMAEKYSLCPSKDKKGDIGYNLRNGLIDEFSDAAFSLKLNTLSEPVKTKEGWHIIKVNDIKYFSDKENFESPKVKINNFKQK